MSRYCPPGMGLSRAHKRSAIRGSGRLVVSYPRPILSYLTWACVIVVSFLRQIRHPGRSNTGTRASENACLLSFIQTVTVGSATHAFARSRYWSQCLVVLLRCVGMTHPMDGAFENRSQPAGKAPRPR